MQEKSGRLARCQAPNKTNTNLNFAPNHVHFNRNLQSKKPNLSDWAVRIMFLGSPTWARTRDLRINSPALYQLSYRGTTKRAF